MPNRLFCSLLEQLESAQDGIVYLAPEKLKGHDLLAVQSLQATGLIQASSPLTEVLCDGCDWHCTKPVAFRHDPQGIASEAFVICDERDDIGRVRVALGRLEMRVFTLAGIANWIASALPMDSMPREVEAGNIFYLGGVSIKDKRHDVFLCRRPDIAITSPAIATANAPIIVSLRNGTDYRKHPVIEVESLIYFENSQPHFNHPYLYDAAKPKTTGKRGAKSHHEWQSYKEKFDDIIAEYGLPHITEPELKNQAAIEKRLTEWGERNFGIAPSPSLLRSHVSTWLKAISADIGV